MHSFKDGLVNAHPLEIKNSFLLEKYNLLWFHQWNAEWGYAVDKRNSAAQKQKIVKFEVNTLANLNPNYVRAKKQTIVIMIFNIILPIAQWDFISTYFDWSYVGFKFNDVLQ